MACILLSTTNVGVPELGNMHMLKRSLLVSGTLVLTMTSQLSAQSTTDATNAGSSAIFNPYTLIGGTLATASLFLAFLENQGGSVSGQSHDLAPQNPFSVTGTSDNTTQGGQNGGNTPPPASGELLPPTGSTPLVTTTPEPSTVALFATGLVGLGTIRRRRGWFGARG